MSQRDAFDDVLVSLHKATFDDACWSAASALIDEACGIKGNMMIYGADASASGNNVAIHMVRFCYRGQRNEDLERKYSEDYYAGDERVPRFRALPDSRLVHVSDLYTDEEKKTSATYNEALPLSDTGNCLNVRLDGPSGSRIAWTFADPVKENSWSFVQTDMIKRLLPHLRQYVRIRQVLADVDGLNASLATLLDHSSVGVIQLDWRGRIVEVNDIASDILKGGSGLFDQEGFLCAQAPADNEILQGLLARALPSSGDQGASGSMSMSHPLGLQRLLLNVSPAGHGDGDGPPWHVAALVLVVNPNRQRLADPALIEAMLGLTPVQSQIAVLLADGNSVRQVAKSTNRSENTIRWHIRRMFEKQGISRLAQLVQLVQSVARVTTTKF